MRERADLTRRVFLGLLACLPAGWQVALGARPAPVLRVCSVRFRGGSKAIVSWGDHRAYWPVYAVPPTDASDLEAHTRLSECLCQRTSPHPLVEHYPCPASHEELMRAFAESAARRSTLDDPDPWVVVGRFPGVPERWEPAPLCLRDWFQHVGTLGGRRRSTQPSYVPVYPGEGSISDRGWRRVYADRRTALVLVRGECVETYVDTGDSYQVANVFPLEGAAIARLAADRRMDVAHDPYAWVEFGNDVVAVSNV